MDDMYLKYGLIIVAIVVIGILINFAIKANSEIKPEKKEQSFLGDSKELAIMINNLCDLCLKKSDLNQDCYILKANIKSGDLKGDFFSDKVKSTIDLGPGNYILKISSEDNFCMVSKIA